MRQGRLDGPDLTEGYMVGKEFQRYPLSLRIVSQGKFYEISWGLTYMDRYRLWVVVSWRLFFDFMPKADDESGDWDFTHLNSRRNLLLPIISSAVETIAAICLGREREKENFDVLTVNQNHSRCKTLILLLRAYFKWELNQMQARATYSCICLVNPFGFNSWNWTKTDASLDLL